MGTPHGTAYLDIYKGFDLPYNFGEAERLTTIKINANGTTAESLKSEAIRKIARYGTSPVTDWKKSKYSDQFVDIHSRQFSDTYYAVLSHHKKQTD